MVRWLCVSVLVACGAATAPDMVVLPPQSSATADPPNSVTITVGQPLACVPSERGHGDAIVMIPHAPNELSPTPGQMTEQAAQAKRLFDSEKWAAAAVALAHVASGESGDDEGNKQLAQYHLGIAQFREHFFDAALATFADIAKDRLHLKWEVSVLWATKLAETDFPHRAHAIDLMAVLAAPQCRGESDPFNNVNQIHLRSEIFFLGGRGALRAGDDALARACFSRLPPNDEYRGLANGCH